MSDTKLNNLDALLQYEVDALYPDLDKGLSFYERLVKRTGWKVSYARTVFSEYKKFMWLASRFTGIAPSTDIDEVWHLHLQYTVEYSLFCEEFFGKFIHHHPGRKELSQKESQESIDFVLNMYINEFSLFSLISDPAVKIVWTDYDEYQGYSSSKHWIVKTRLLNVIGLVFQQLILTIATPIVRVVAFIYSKSKKNKNI